MDIISVKIFQNYLAHVTGGWSLIAQDNTFTSQIRSLIIIRCKQKNKLLNDSNADERAGTASTFIRRREIISVCNDVALALVWNIYNIVCRTLCILHWCLAMPRPVSDYVWYTCFMLISWNFKYCLSYLGCIYSMLYAILKNAKCSVNNSERVWTNL